MYRNSLSSRAQSRDPVEVTLKLSHWDPSTVARDDEGRGKEFDGTLPNPHFLRLRRLRFHLQVGGLIRAAGEIYAGTFLRHRDALFDAQIAHRRNCVATDFAHRTRRCGGTDVRA